MKLITLVLAFSALTTYAKKIETPQTKNITMNAMLDLTESGHRASKGNDIWGWTDPETGKEIAIMGLNSKTSFVDVTNPNAPIHIADIKTRTFNSSWRDIKVYKNHAYIVSEAYSHGMQIFDMTRLRDINPADMPVKLEEDVKYKGFGNAHNIAINEETGYAYAVGTSTCDGGLHIMSIKEPKNPVFLTCVGRGVYEVPRAKLMDGNAYTHDVQCVIYKGEDERFIGREICVSSNEDTINVVDVTDKNNPHQISVSTYQAVAYTHQGWLSPDHKYFYLGDELDEQRFNVNTKTFIWDFSDLTNIKKHAEYVHKTKAIDHNMYTKGQYIFQANYDAGLRVLDASQVDTGILTEVAFMDTMPTSDRAVFQGVWSVFPYFKSDTVIVSGINGVLYISTPSLK